MKKTLLLLTIIISFCSCSKDNETYVDTSSKEFIIFGHYYGMCGGEECVEIFKLTENQLLEDVNDDYMLDDLNFTPLTQEQFDLVNDLPNFIPTQLLEEEDGVFGCPDCADQGGIFFTYVTENNIQTWRIDQDKTSIPTYLHDFVDVINYKISLINN